jgi:hypothetical protein
MRVLHHLHPHVSFVAQPTNHTHLILRPKPGNRHGDFVGQITKPQLPVLRPKSGNPSKWFWGQPIRTVATGFQPKLGETVAIGFEAKPGETVDIGFEAKPKKLTLLVSLCTVQTAHSITWLLDRPATEYPTCAWPSPILCTKSSTPASILITVRHAAPVTYTLWDKQTRFSTWNKW